MPSYSEVLAAAGAVIMRKRAASRCPPSATLHEIIDELALDHGEAVTVTGHMRQIAIDGIMHPSITVNRIPMLIAIDNK